MEMMTSASCTANLVCTMMPHSPNTHVHSLLKEAPALASLFDPSLSILQVEVTVLPRYWTMFGCEGKSPCEGCSNISAFHKLIIRPKALVVLTGSWQVLAGLVHSGLY